MAVFSVPFMWILWKIYEITFSMLILYSKIYIAGKTIGVFLLGIFVVKTPIYFLHMWLPKAHVEASVMGSIILAAILLKLGTYGLSVILRIYNMGTIIQTILVLGVIFRGGMCIIYSDLKAIIAISSVFHIRLLSLRLIRVRKYRLISTFIIVVRHRYISSILFYFRYVITNVTSTRNLYLLTGFKHTLIIYGIFTFRLIINIGVPILPRFVGELYIFTAIYQSSFFMILVIFYSILISCYFFIFCAFMLSHGKRIKNINLYLFSYSTYIILTTFTIINIIHFVIISIIYL